ncbi:hypothetical protein HMPREF1043_0514, partial [Streptococcus anginosus subsp. whileyi CCUG 39159]
SRTWPPSPTTPSPRCARSCWGPSCWTPCSRSCAASRSRMSPTAPAAHSTRTPFLSVTGTTRTVVCGRRSGPPAAGRFPWGGHPCGRSSPEKGTAQPHSAERSRSVGNDNITVAVRSSALATALSSSRGATVTDSRENSRMSTGTHASPSARSSHCSPNACKPTVSSSSSASVNSMGSPHRRRRRS